MANNSPEVISSAEQLRPQDVREAMRTLPDFEQMELDVLIEEVGDIDKRQELAQKIADQLMDTLPDAPDREELVEKVMEQLDGVQEELQIERDEIIEKGNRFEAIENDPAKKSLLGKALDVVKNGWEFSWKHKWKILAVVAVIATGVAGWYYWNLLMSLLPGAGMGGTGFSTGAAGAESVGEGVGAAAAAGEAVEGTIDAQILSNLGFEEGAAHIIKGVEVAGDGLVTYGGQQYTAAEFATMAEELAAEQGNVLIDGQLMKDLTSGGIREVSQELQSRGIMYNLRSGWEGGNSWQYLDPLYNK
jgi:hypothetical protein